MTKFSSRRQFKHLIYDLDKANSSSGFTTKTRITCNGYLFKDKIRISLNTQLLEKAMTFLLLKKSNGLKVRTFVDTFFFLRTDMVHIIQMVNL